MSVTFLRPLDDTMLSTQTEETDEMMSPVVGSSMFPEEASDDDADVYFDQDTYIFTDASTSVPPLVEGKTVQFVGDVGVGERSIRTEEPINKPEAVVTRRTVMVTPPSPRTNGRKLSFRRKPKPPQEQEVVTETVSFEPFVEPFMLSSGEMSTKPRMITYFETEVTAAPEEVEASNGNKAECIAIGMSGKRFDVRKSMPGTHCALQIHMLHFVRR